MADYRVKVHVEFTVDIGTTDKASALIFAEYMTGHVFKEDFARAENVIVDAMEVDEMFDRQEADRASRKVAG